MRVERAAQHFSDSGHSVSHLQRSALDEYDLTLQPVAAQALPANRHAAYTNGGLTVMDVLIAILVFCIVVAIAFWPARVAARKGHSFLGYFIFSLIFFPAALIVAYVVDDRSVGIAPA